MDAIRKRLLDIEVDRWRRSQPGYDDGFVYAMTSDVVDLVKIGFSRKPDQRALDISNMSPVKVKVIARRPGRQQDETALHRRLNAYRSHGEWFRMEGEVLTVLAEMKAKLPKERRKPAKPRGRTQMWPDGASRRLTEIVVGFGRPTDERRLKPYLSPRPDGEPFERVAWMWRPHADRLGVHPSWYEPGCPQG